MKPSHIRLFIIVLALASFSFASDTIPEAAWRRPIGQPLENPGGKKPEIQGMIDDGYWQGAPVGGLEPVPFPARIEGSSNAGT